MIVSAILDRVSEVLQDKGRVTWIESDLLAWFNEAQRAVAQVRADASSVIGNITLVAGTKQTLPTGGRRLIDVRRNMGTDGATPGRVIDLIAEDDLDRFNPDWHTDTAAAVILNYMVHDMVPGTFYVYPQTDGITRVEAAYKIEQKSLYFILS